jgi:hypothetical protein
MCMTAKIPIVFIGETNSAEDFYKTLAPDKSVFIFFTVPPCYANNDAMYKKLETEFPTLIPGPGSVGCTLAHAQAQAIILKHYQDISPIGIAPLKNTFEGGFVFESDAEITKYGRQKFVEFSNFAHSYGFKLIQLGGLKSSSGRKGQKIDWINGLRNYFLSNIAHDIKEDLLQFFRTSLKVVPGFIGGTHAYYIHVDAIRLFQMQPAGFLAAIDDYYKSISWNLGWVGRTRQNLFIQSDFPSFIDSLGR